MGFFILSIFVLSAIYVQTRGTVAHAQIKRRITDHTNLFAPINVLFYAFSKVPTTPFVAMDHFADLKVLEDNWEVIRDEAMHLDA